MFQPFDLLAVLADGKFHSAKQLALHYGISRMTICNAVRRLAAAGVAIQTVRGRGYRLSHSFELLNADQIRNALDDAARKSISRIDVFPSIDSTNNYLMRSAAQGVPSAHVCLAESQYAGKGRQGRRWASPFGRNIYLSVLWRFESCSVQIGGLSLLVALAVAEALESIGVRGICLKWPNDIQWHENKVGGILLEISGDVDGACHVVIGVGINVNMTSCDLEDIEQPWSDLVSILGTQLPSRNELAARLISWIVHGVHDFERVGLSDLSSKWDRYDCLAGKTVQLRGSAGIIYGCAVGIDDLGRLLLKVGDSCQAYASGEVSVRAKP